MAFVDKLILQYESTGTAALLKNNQKIIDQFKKIQTQSDESFSQIGNKIKQFGKSMQFTGYMFTSALTLPIVSFGKASYAAFQEFDSAMRNVRAAAGDTGQVVNDELYAQMVAKVKEVSSNTTISLNDVSNGFYELISAGLTVQQAIDNIGESAKFAEAANIDMGTATQFAAQMLKIYGDATHDTGSLMDITSIAVQKSQAHFEDFVHNVQMASSFAKSANQSYEELAGAFMILADRGVPAANAGMQLRQAFQQMIDPSNKAAEEFKRLNIAVYDANGKFKPLSYILSELRKKTSTMTDEQKNLTLSTLFNVRAGQAMRTLLQLTDEEYNKYIDTVSNASGTTEQMATVVEESASGKWDKFKNKLEVTKVEIGAKLIPVMEDLIQIATNLSERFLKLDPSTQTFIIKIGLVTAALGPVLIVLGSLIQLLAGPVGLFVTLGKISGGFTTAAAAIKTLTTGMSTFSSISGKAFSAISTFAAFLTNPWVVAIGLAIAAIAGIIVYFNNKKKSVDDNLTSIESLKRAEENYANKELAFAQAEANVVRSKDAVKAAQDNLNQKVAEFGPNSQEAIDAGKLLTEAELQLRDASKQAADRLTELNTAAMAVDWATAATDMSTFGSKMQDAASKGNLLAGALSDINDIVFKSTVPPIFPKSGSMLPKIPLKANGGIIKAASGVFVPGSSALQDRVPAMLTPGELVLNKAQQENLANSMNNGGQTVNVNINVGTMIASRGEQREFARKIKQLLNEDNSRYTNSTTQNWSMA